MTDTLNWRYACKAYDSSRKISAEDWQTILDSLVLTPSSFGLQPWKFIVVESVGLREQLVEHSWGQKQVTDASHFLVLTHRRSVDEAVIDEWMEKLSAVQGRTPDELSGYKGVLMGFVEAMDEQAIASWTHRQVYIALGQLMTVAAELRIDTTPMEGIVPAEYDRILGLEGTDFTTSVACALGYRSADDKYATTPKARFDATQVIETI